MVWIYVAYSLNFCPRSHVRSDYKHWHSEFPQYTERQNTKPKVTEPPGKKTGALRDPISSRTDARFVYVLSRTGIPFVFVRVNADYPGRGSNYCARPKQPEFTTGLFMICYTVSRRCRDVNSRTVIISGL